MYAPLKILFLIFPASLVTPLSAQDDYRKNFESFSSSVGGTYRGFADSANAAFVRTLQEQWERFRLSDGYERSAEPWPSVPSVSDGTSPGTHQSIEVIETVDTLPKVWPLEDMATSGMEVCPEDGRGYVTVSFGFYDTPVSVRIPERYGRFHPSDISERGVAAFWNELSSCDFSPVISSCMSYRRSCGLNDWAVLEWTQKLAEVIFPEDICCERTIFTVFIMNQMGLMTKLARSGNSLLCLFSSMQRVYGRKYVVIDTYPYYLSGETASGSDIFSYRSVFSGKKRPLDLRIDVPLKLGGGKQEKILRKSSSVFGSSFGIPLNASVLSFYSHYPQMDVAYYVSARPDGKFIAALKSFLEPFLGEDRNESLNRLLSFVQRDFDYRVDLEQFGYEKPFFCEENFLYECNDCEDRVILFAFIAGKIFGYDVILLEYPDHISAAVRMEGDVKGDYVKRGEARYYVCDPTYIGACAGMTIPEYRNVPAKVWMIE